MQVECWVLYPVLGPFLSCAISPLCFLVTVNYTSLLCLAIPPWCSCLKVSRSWSSLKLWAKLNFPPWNCGWQIICPSDRMLTNITTSNHQVYLSHIFSRTNPLASLERILKDIRNSLLGKCNCYPLLGWMNSTFPFVLICLADISVSRHHSLTSLDTPNTSSWPHGPDRVPII